MIRSQVVSIDASWPAILRQKEKEIIGRRSMIGRLSGWILTP